ncbi:hypothetical protein AAC387_Pa06g2176 [Persea americana]
MLQENQCLLKSDLDQAHHLQIVDMQVNMEIAEPGKKKEILKALEIPCVVSRSTSMGKIPLILYCPEEPTCCATRNRRSRSLFRNRGVDRSLVCRRRSEDQKGSRSANCAPPELLTRKPEEQNSVPRSSLQKKKPRSELRSSPEKAACTLRSLLEPEKTIEVRTAFTARENTVQTAMLVAV